MYQLIYMSRMVRRCTPVDLDQIASAAEAHNRAAGVTGSLVVWNGCFLQILEGDQEVVEATFDRIEQDPRHTDIEVVAAGLIPARRFQGWTTQVIEFDDPSPQIRQLITRHPPLIPRSTHYADPMLAFALLYDVGFVLGASAQAA